MLLNYIVLLCMCIDKMFWNNCIDGIRFIDGTYKEYW